MNSFMVISRYYLKKIYLFCLFIISLSQNMSGVFFAIFFLSGSLVFAKTKESQASILYFLDEKNVVVRTNSSLWDLGEIIAIRSQNSKAGVLGFLEVVKIEKGGGDKYDLKARLLLHSRYHLVQPGDLVEKLDLTQKSPSYKGTTELIIKEGDQEVSSFYRPLVYQGFFVGETAQTLWPREFLLTFYGDLFYGVSDRLTVRALLPAFAYGAPNGKIKWKAFDSRANTVSIGISANQIPTSHSTSVNIDFYWDSISSEDTVSHSFLSLALFSFENAADLAAIKSLGTTSLQSGYQIILKDWNRVLFGPVYNFQKQTLGGYLSYMMLWDRFHFSATLNSTNIASWKFSPEDGYYGFIEGFWRF